jgi:predicted lipoprotein
MITKPRPLATSILVPAAILAALSVAYQSVLAGDQTHLPSVSKQAMLESIARKVLAPGYAALAASATNLSASADALSANPSLSSLKQTRLAWTQVLLAWRRTQPFAHGPVADLGAYPRIQFWPSRVQSVERVLRAQRPLDDAYVQELGANVVGLSTLELLLFDPHLDDAARVAAFTGASGERQRLYLQALARDLVKQTRLVARAWQAPTGYVTAFGAGGQAQLNVLVNDILESVETGAESRLRLVLERHAEGQFRGELLEGGLSGMSQQGLLALLTGARSLFSGADGLGIDDYLRQLKSPAAGRVDLQFQKAITAVRALGGPLEQAIATRQDAVRRAHEECRALQIMLKTEVASTLGVTITFKSTDND